MRLLALLLLLPATACVTVPRPRAAIVLPPSVWPRDTLLHWYDIEGDTEAELRAQLDARGPEGHDAYTAWHVTWKFPFLQTEEGCTTGPVTTAVRVNVTLPRWKAPADERDPLVRRWRRYLDALKEHESGHRETGFRAATDITETLPALPPKPTCEEAEEAANAAAREVLERYRAGDLTYDAETRHGATQGAVFP
ncbi:MAG: DUF922 domain-containing protein [Archangium sp.]|nr:DUF922 domain-containing protein [Archangium sp.]